MATPHLDRIAGRPQAGSVNPRLTSGGCRFKRWCRLAGTPRPCRPRMLSRFRPPFARAKRSRLRGAVSAYALWLPHGAFGLVPPRHGDRRQMDAPIPVTPNAFSNPATLGGPRVVPAPQRRPLTAFATASQVLSQRPIQPRPCPRRRLIIAYLERAPPSVSILDPTHHRATKALARGGIREIDRDRAIQNPAGAGGGHSPTNRRRSSRPAKR